MVRESQNFQLQLSKNRENYYRARQKLRDDYQTSLDHLVTKNANKAKEIFKIREKEKQRMNDAHELQLQIVKDKSNELLSDRRNFYLQNLERLNSENRDISRKQKASFDRRLGDVSEAYNRSIEENKRLTGNLLRRINQNFENRIKTNNKISSQELERVRDKANQGILDHRFELEEQKKALVRRNKAEKDKIIKAAITKDLETKEYFQDKYDQLKIINDAELQRVNQKHEQSLTKARKSDRETLNTLNESYEKTLKKIADENTKSLEEVRHKNFLERKSLERAHKEESLKKDRETELQIRANGGKEQVEFEKEQIKKKYETRLDGLKAQMFDNGIQNLRNMEKLEEAFKDSIKSKNLETKEFINKATDEFAEVTKAKEERFRRKQDAVTSSFRRKLSGQESEFKDQIIFEKSNAKKLLENQKRDLNKTIVDLNERNIKDVKTLTEAFAKEKKITERRHRKEFAEGIQKNREDFNSRTESLVAAYENRLELMKKNHKEDLKVLQKKIDLLAEEKDLSEKRALVYQTEVRQAEKQEIFNRLRDSKKRYEKEKVQLKKKQQRKLAQLESQRQIELNNTVRKYESALNKMRLDYEQIIKRKDAETRSNLKSFAQEAKFEKDNIIATFQQKLDNVRNSYAERAVAASGEQKES